MRVVCPGCGRPAVVCVCAVMPALPTRTRVVLLQHPRERRKGIGTARMAHLALPGSLLRVGVDFAADPVVQEATGGGDVYVLFPGREARDVADLPRDRPITLVVVDGTWWQARKLIRLNPALATLPRVAFTPRRPSDYRIRRQPAATCVSTIEALAEVLGALEPDGARFEALRDPFQAMVRCQERFSAEVNDGRHRRAHQARPARPRLTLAQRMDGAWPRLVCAQGEANAWPARHPERRSPETVHWAAHRPATGATLDLLLAPRSPLAPGTPRYAELPAAAFAGGMGVQAWRAAWAGFTRPDDLLVVWGTFYRDLAASDGLALTQQCLDLRPEVSQLLCRRVGTLEEAARLLDVGTQPLGPGGRCGRRLTALVAVLRAVWEARPGSARLSALSAHP